MILPKLKSTTHCLLSLLALIGWAGCEPLLEQRPQPTYAFIQESDARGWSITGNGEYDRPEYSSTGGNPGGYIHATDQAANAWYFSAPNSLITQLRVSYGQVLSYDLKQSATSDQYKAADLILQSGTTQLVLNVGNNPGVNWTSYAIKLDASLYWRNGQGQLVSKEIFQQVLANLDHLSIRGEYRYGDDQGGLDNLIVK